MWQTSPHCRVLPPSELNGMIAEPLSVCWRRQRYRVLAASWCYVQTKLLSHKMRLSCENTTTAGRPGRRRTTRLVRQSMFYKLQHSNLSLAARLCSRLSTDRHLSKTTVVFDDELEAVHCTAALAGHHWRRRPDWRVHGTTARVWFFS